MGHRALSLPRFNLFAGRLLSSSNLRFFIRRAGLCTFIAGNSIGAIRMGEYFHNFMPRWRSAVDLNDPFNPNGYILNDWGKFLVGSHIPFNKMWWQWSYGRLHGDPLVANGLSKPFSKVNRPFSPIWTWKSDQLSEENDDVALNNVCHNLSVYRTHELKGDVLRDFWTFCSAGGGEIVYLRFPKGKMPANHPLANQLHSFVDMYSPSNDWFWNIRQIEFELGVLPFIKFFHWHPSKSVREMCRDVYEYKNQLQLAINTMNSDSYGVLRFCGLATLPEGLERTAESYAYEEMMYGYRNSRVP